ncbi:MAG TPA: hypothetical protein VIH08_12025, partial [Blastococcus sp.]
VTGHRRLGDVLVAQGALTAAQLRTLLDLQASREEGWLRIGELAIVEGYITGTQLARALATADDRPSLATMPAAVTTPGR